MTIELRGIRSLRRMAGVALAAGLVVAGGPADLTAGQDAPVTQDALEQPAPGAWLSYGRDPAETHFSPLAQIDRTNVSGMTVAWSWEIPRTGARLEAVPVVHDGVMYATGARSYLYALDARTGELLWEWDPGIVDERDGGPSVCCGDVNRGVAVYGDRVFIGLLDGRLVALDRTTGSVDWEVQTTPLGADYSITGAPRIAAGLVVIGNGGAEYGVRGYVTAYQPETGAEAWRFYTVPGNPADGFENEAMRRAAETWNGEWWQIGGGGTVWDGMAYDPEAGLLYIGTGNGSPWNRDIRSPGGGDNLYLSSIVALEASTGEYVWHYQTTPGDDWDYTATQPLMLLDLEIDGAVRKVVVQAPKNGFFYVIDRLTGEFISAEPFADDVTWASAIDPSTGRPIESPSARYGTTGEPVYLSPGATGAHNWRPMAWNPNTGLVYLPAQNNTMLYAKAPEFSYRPGVWNTGVSLGRIPNGPTRPTLTGPPSMLLGWDPVENRERWRMVGRGGNGGTLSTAGGLVFWGTGRELVALDAESGTELWASEVGNGTATPVSFELDGRQYIAISAGGSGGMPERMWAFALPGDR